MTGVPPCGSRAQNGRNERFDDGKPPHRALRRPLSHDPVFATWGFASAAASHPPHCVVKPSFPAILRARSARDATTPSSTPPPASSASLCAGPSVAAKPSRFAMAAMPLRHGPMPESLFMPWRRRALSWGLRGQLGERTDAYVLSLRELREVRVVAASRPGALPAVQDRAHPRAPRLPHLRLGLARAARPGGAIPLLAAGPPLASRRPLRLPRRTPAGRYSPTAMSPR